MNPFNLPGPEFLLLFVVGMVTLLLLRGLFHLARPPLDEPLSVLHRDLDPYEVAYLEGGLVSAVKAAIAALGHDGDVSIDDAGLTASLAHHRNHWLEASVERAIVEGATSFDVVKVAVKSGESSLSRRLLERKLIQGPETFARRNAWLGWLWYGFVGFGALKVLVGMAREKPVGLLVGLLITLALIGVAAFPLPRRTGRGDNALNRLREKHAALKGTVEADPSLVESVDTAFAVALFGPEVLLAARPETAKALGATPPTGAGGGVDGGCGGGGCGGGCGGCGGCGG